MKSMGILRAVVIVGFASFALSVFAEDSPQDTNKGPDRAEKDHKHAADPPGMKRLSPDYDAWIDPKNKRVVLDGEICLRQGQLEMFACPKGTKEHESVVAVPIKAYIIHAALLAVGAQPGTPVKFQPKYEPATGAPIDITCIWTDEKGQVRRQPAQNWIRDVKSGKPMTSSWVFAGSGFWQDEQSGQKMYLADSGDFICVSNFASAMLDLPVESSDANDALQFQAFTENIPPLGTKVRLVLTPRLDKKAGQSKSVADSKGGRVPESKPTPR